jgi:hypothetical protein
MDINHFDMKLIEFIKILKNDTTGIKNIKVSSYDDLIIIYTDTLSSNLKYSNKIIDSIIHQLDWMILTSSYDIIYYKKRNIIVTDANRQILINNWSNCNVYINYIGEKVLFFKHNEKLLFVMRNIIYDYTQHVLIKSICPNIFSSYTIPQYVTIISSKLSMILSYEQNSILEKISKPMYSNKIFFSCFDELEFNLIEENKKTEHTKKLTNAGYLIEYNNDIYLLQNKLYEKISKLIPVESNRMKQYLDLYKSDNLNYIINYIYLYPFELIKRINLSIKTLSKEFLNIYHLTRNHSNPELYEQLSSDDKKILYELHQIFITSRQNDFESTQSKQLEFIDKKSLTIDTVYKYLKKMDIEQFVKLYTNRPNLILKLKEANILHKIFFEDDINVRTIEILLNK